MNPIETATYYFEVSNKSDFTEIEKLFTDSSTYSSQNTGLYLWRDSIIAMQKIFHTSFDKLVWNIESIEEEKEWIVKVVFTFRGEKDKKTISFSGVEYVVVYQWKIQHIDIRNK